MAGWLLGLVATPAMAMDDEHRKIAKASVEKAIVELRKLQAADGSWSAKPSGPAMTGLVVTGMLKSGVPKTDPAIVKAVAYILSKQKASGGIYDEILPNYNTSICLMALGHYRDDEKYKPAITKAQDFLRKLQFDEEEKDDQGKVIDKNHVHYGGQGYGNHGRPDLSNTAVMIAGLNDSGLDCKDPAYIRAMQFISQLQGSKTNAAYGDKIESGGGFIYAPSVNKDKVGVAQSMAGVMKDSNGVERLRTYGSMTYAGFMSYLYAKLNRDDVRVVEAYAWIRQNYTLEKNPGIPGKGMEGYFYYIHLMSRALDAWRVNPETGKKEATLITTADGKKRDWGNELAAKLAAMQRKDGLWENTADRWMEGDPILCTAFAMISLGHAME